MTNVQQWFAELSLWWWPRLADHLWQSTVFALVVIAAASVLKRGPARLRHTFWLLASAKFMVPISLLVFLAQQAGLESLSLFGPSQATEQNLLLQGMTEPVSLAFNYEFTTVATSASNETYPVLTLIWLSGCAALLTIWGFRRQKFSASLNSSRVMQHGREWDALKRAQASLGLNCRVRLVVSRLKIEPGVWRIWRPTIVLPESIATLLDDDELEAIMIHELVHIQRRDNLIRNLHLAISAVLWFHPLVWFIGRKLFDEREQACDERVMEVSNAPEAYASSILKVVRFCFGWKLTGAIGAASGSNLRRRIENIMSTANAQRKAGPVSRLLAGTLVGIAFIVLVGAGVYSRPLSYNSVPREIQPDPVAAMTTADVVQGDVPNAPAEPSSKKSKSKNLPPPPPPPAQPPQPPDVEVGVGNGAGVGIGRGIGVGVDKGGRVAPSTIAPPPPPAAPASEREKSKQKNKGKVEKGELIEAPPPVYPEEAKKEKIEGLVTVAIVIGEDGNVISAKAKSGPEALHDAAETAASKARFRPTTVNGKPAKVSGAMSYNFVLDKN